MLDSKRLAELVAGGPVEIVTTPPSAAPPHGLSPTFEGIMERVEEALAGDPATRGIPPEIKREVMAKALSKYAGMKFKGIITEDGGGIIPNSLKQALEPQAKPGLAVPKAGPDEPYWYERPEDARLIEHFILSRLALGPRIKGGLLVTGPAGSGKTVGVIRAIERLNAAHPELGLPLLVMDCATLTDPQKWFGRREIDKDGTRYETSAFVEAVQSGAAILLDEFMRLHPNIHNPVMSLFSGTETALLSDLNLQIVRHPRTVFIGTTNQGSQFGGTHRMDWAMRERWGFTIERDFPPTDEETKILVDHNPGCDLDAAAVLVDIARSTRDMWQKGDLRAPISTRTLDNAAFLVASGMSEREALEYTALPEYDGGAEGNLGGTESERAKVKGIIEGRTTTRESYREYAKGGPVPVARRKTAKW